MERWLKSGVGAPRTRSTDAPPRPLAPQIMLGLIGEGTGIAAKVLKSMGASRATAPPLPARSPARRPYPLRRASRRRMRAARSDPTSSAPPILTDIFDDILAAGISLKEARIEVEKIIGRGSGFVAVEIPFTPRAKRVLELALEEARQLGHNYIGTEHLLLGLLREGEGVAARVLENLDATPSPSRRRPRSRCSVPM